MLSLTSKKYSELHSCITAMATGAVCHSSSSKERVMEYTSPACLTFSCLMIIRQGVEAGPRHGGPAPTLHSKIIELVDCIIH